MCAPPVGRPWPRRVVPLGPGCGPRSPACALAAPVAPFRGPPPWRFPSPLLSALSGPFSAAALGPPPSAGRRAPWLLLRLPVLGPPPAFRWRPRVGAAALSVAPRVARSLRCPGLRAPLAPAPALAALARRLGSAAVAG
ncbi:type VII secretion protein EccE, partial [Mycobacterium tuberculosis]|uniref:type VII secretion protein EccE n=1 Tax=Mycobacterium tuberculosis TaxID=1773 RepID=UPI00300FE6EF